MNYIRVELSPDIPYNSGASISLKFDNGNTAQCSFKIEDYVRIQGPIDKDAVEFAYFTSVIYSCDRVVKRDIPLGDRWTREIGVRIPVADPAKWSSASGLCELMLEFLTGDVWHLDFVEAQLPIISSELENIRNSFRNRRHIYGDAVSLFSGGLDSLVGVIDWLEDNPSSRLILASTYDSHAENAKMDQGMVFWHLDRHYPFRLQHYTARTGVRSLGEDPNFRSRSLAFIGNAVLAASFLADDTPIIIPENGGIALNYPLTPSRRGSLSTRTVHPYFLGMIGEFINLLGMKYTISNPYGLKTKGEMMLECKNQQLLQTSYADSASCGKRGHKELWSDRQAQQCGACVPCLFRRAAVHKAGLEPDRYGVDLLSGTTVNSIRNKPNHDLSAMIEFIKRNDDDKTIWRTLRSAAPLPIDMKNEYISLVKRLRNEAQTLLNTTGII